MMGAMTVGEANLGEGVEGMRVELRSLDDGVRGIREKLEEEGRKRDERIEKSETAITAAHDAADRANNSAKWGRWIALASTGVALLGIAAAAIGISIAVNANNDRKHNKISACEQSNVAVQRTADASKQNFDDFIDLLVAYGGNTADPVAVQAAKNKQHVKIQAEADKPFAQGGLHRDCSPLGIARYYAGTAVVTSTTGRR